jgi:OFA family oxalate/formate antiporter-like MFS transporter
MTATKQATGLPSVEGAYFRWLQLAMGIACMAMIANLQYGWTLFVDPIDAKYHWGRAAIQLAFTLFVVTETWLVPVEAWFVDKYGPRVVIMFGGLMIALAWVLNSFANSLGVLALARGRSTEPASATPSNGFPTVAALPPAPPPPASAPAPRSPWCRSPT